MAIIRREFDAREQAQEFIKAINLKLGIPSSENSVAQSYTDIVEEDGKFYVEYDNEIIIFEE
jgi:RNA binding exosome subunit